MSAETSQINVSHRIDQLLQRVAKLTTADKLKPTRFDARGERHARAIAARDRDERAKKSAKVLPQPSR